MSADEWNKSIWAEAVALLDRAENLHRQFFRPGVTRAEVVWEPPVDVLEDEREVLVIAALPGVRREDLEVHVDRDVLVVRGRRAMPAMGRGAVVRRLEVPYGRFERRLPLSGAPFRLERLELSDGCVSLRLVKQF